MRMNRVSHLFQPFVTSPKPAEKLSKSSLSQKLLTDLGIIRQTSSTGLYHMLPLGSRVMQKLENLARKRMSEIGAQEIKFPFLVDADHWKISGRYNTEDIFNLKDRHEKEYILSPTNEESAADLLSTIPLLNQNQLPISLYQISTKFRDEIKPRCGLIRSREFIMKDLYTFDSTQDSAMETYEKVSTAYEKFFQDLNLPYIKADPGEMGGSHSHEYHVVCEIGEEELFQCESCNYYSKEKKCKCNFKKITGLEVAHTFYLGQRYTKPLKSIYKNKAGENKSLEMGSYGLGLTRILAACLETKSKLEEIRWPSAISPFQIVIISPKEGSKESLIIGDLPTKIYFDLNGLPGLNDQVIFDDRSNLTIGRRILLSKKTGYPYIVIAGSKAAASPPVFELICVEEGKNVNLSHNELLNYFKVITH